jgi:PAS domain-containing protein
VINLLHRSKTRKQNELFNAALNNMSQGLLMFDAQDRLILFNKRYAEIFRLDPASIRLGMTFADLLRLRKEVGTFRPDVDEYLARVIDANGRFRSNPDRGKFGSEGYETKFVELLDGRCISITNQRMPGGGWVATYCGCD